MNRASVKAGEHSIREFIQQRLRSARVLNMSFIAAVLIWGLIITITVGGSSGAGSNAGGLNPTIESRALIFLAFYGVIAVLVALIVIPRRNSIEILSEKHGEGAIEETVQGLVGAHVIRCAVIETIGLGGFVLAFLSQNVTYYWLFGGLAVVLLVLVFPRRSTWEEAQFFLERKYG